MTRADAVRHPTSQGGQVAKFLSTGGVATVVTIGLFNLLVHAGERPVLHSRPVAAYVLAIAVGTIVSYAGNRWWAFRHRQSGGVVRDLAPFVAINLAAVAIPVLCLGFSRQVLEMDSALADNVSANAVGLVLATGLRYWGYQSWVFKEPVPDSS